MRNPADSHTTISGVILRLPKAAIAVIASVAGISPKRPTMAANAAIATLTASAPRQSNFSQRSSGSCVVTSERIANSAGTAKPKPNSATTDPMMSGNMPAPMLESRPIGNCTQAYPA